MTWNMLLWKWSPEFDTPAKRRKAGVKNAEVAQGFARDNEHPAIGMADIAALRRAIDDTFGTDEDYRPLVFEDYGRCAVVNYPNDVRFEVAPKVGGIARRFGLNSCEF